VFHFLVYIEPVIYEEPPVSTLFPAEGYCFGSLDITLLSTINIVPDNTARCRISQSQNAVTNIAFLQRSLGDSPRDREWSENGCQVG
jgi:hypothetical protein